jgi:hypothetical protein
MLRKIDWESQIGRRLKLRDLHVFSTVVQCGSMAKAARQLGVSHPAVSEVVADLEHAVGVRLLDRSARGIATIYSRAPQTGVTAHWHCPISPERIAVAILSDRSPATSGRFLIEQV